MQQAALEKLKNLVRISPVLGSAERQEWLSMVDAMNDKQLHDLEKILTAGLSHVATAAAPAAPSLPQNPVPPLRTPTAPAQPPQPSPAEQKFRQQLDRTVAEPEIEGGEEMPELPAPQPVDTKPAPVPPRPVGVSGMPTAMEPKPVQVARPPVGVAPTMAPVVLKPFAPKLPVRPQPPLPPLKPVLPPLPKPQVPAAPLPVVPAAPAVAIPAVPAQAAPDFSQKQSPSSVVGSGELPKTTADLERLSVALWSGYSGAEFVAAVQKVMASSGRHATSGALQTSPLFAAYIQTGLAALSARTGSEPPPTNLLSRAQFEHLTDQLKELHIP